MKLKTDDQRVVQALAKAGVSVESVWDLVNSGRSVRRVVPTLLSLLPCLTDAKVKAGVARALTSPEARGGKTNRVLIEEMRRVAETSDDFLNLELGWALGNALSIVVAPNDFSVFEDLVEIFRDSRLGGARQMVADAIAKTRHPNATQVLMDALSDNQLKGHAIFALGRLRAVEARNSIEPFLNDSNSWIRKAAKRALSKIDKA